MNNIDKTKQWLCRGWEIKRELCALVCAKESALSLACGTNINTDSEKVQTSVTNSSENKFIKLCDLSFKIDKRIDELCGIQTEILDAIEKVPDSILRTFLIERYVNFKTFEQIAEALFYSDKWVRTKLHQKAVCEIEKIILDNEMREAM